MEQSNILNILNIDNADNINELNISEYKEDNSNSENEYKEDNSNNENEYKEDNSNNENMNKIENNVTSRNYDQQYDMYLRGLEAAAEQYKQMYPEKYEKAQSIGDDMMNKNYELHIGEDLKGDMLKCKNIFVSVLQYGLEMGDLYEDEIELLKKVLTGCLNVTNDINDIFKNFETIENIISLLKDKLSEFDNYY